MSSTKDGGGAITTVARAETNVTNNYDVLLYRGVSGKLATQTISGTFDVVLGCLESNAAANMFWHVHVYVTTGDSDTVRATLINDFIGATEWPTTAVGRTLGASSAISASITDGDRLVVEIGYRAANTVTTSYTGTLWYGTQNADDLSLAGDLADAGDETTLAGFINLSADLVEESDAIAIRLSQTMVKVLETNSPAVRLSQTMVKALVSNQPAVRLSQTMVKVLRSTASTPISSDDETFFMGAWL